MKGKVVSSVWFTVTLLFVVKRAMLDKRFLNSCYVMLRNFAVTSKKFKKNGTTV